MYGNPYMPQTQGMTPMPVQTMAPQYVPPNPWQARLAAMEQPQSGNPYRIVNVTGENGARAFQMPPNSNILLLDDTAPIVWLAQTDGAGYKTVTPYTITPYQPEPPSELRGLEERIARLEAMLSEPDPVTAGQSAAPKPGYAAAAEPAG